MADFASQHNQQTNQHLSLPGLSGQPFSFIKKEIGSPA
jgi:hypothetical protein